MKPIIEVKGIWKEYQRGAQQAKYLSLRDQLGAALKPSAKKEKFWALEDINFSVAPGESLAIIGKNGAGKSTLLKILSRITPPTRGEIILRGRIASLLEVGTGFHPELTGKENIYLNGSILGLERKEIERQFDAIVDFSGVEKFLTTPLKHYSSGMQLRLAFAVAAHLEPEILVIDEVLAVGDSAFQQKCIQKMTEVSQSGRTILFVSHNLQAVRNLCDRAVLLEAGKSVLQGSVEQVLTAYTSTSQKQTAEIDLRDIKPRKGIGGLKFVNLQFNKDAFTIGDQLTLQLSIHTDTRPDSFKDLDFGIAVDDSLGNTVHHFSNRFLNKSVSQYNPQLDYTFAFDVQLKPGIYNLTLFIRASEVIQDWLTIDGAIKVEESNLYNYNDSSGISGILQIPFDFSESEKISKA